MKPHLRRALRIGAQVLLTVVTLLSGKDAWDRFHVLSDAQAGSAERDEVIGELTKDLDQRWNARRHYNPDTADEHAWYGSTPRTFPPGPPAPWASDVRWNRIAFRPSEDAKYRYALYTRGDEAFLFSFGDADGDGRLSQVHRRFKSGVLTQEWSIDPEE